MIHRKHVNGRPSGTDGSDFSYRMVVDSRYQKVADGKSRLSVLIFTQTCVQLITGGVLLLSAIKGAVVDLLSASCGICCVVSLFLGQVGQKRSRVGLLKFYMIGSSITILPSLTNLFTSENPLEIFNDLSRWDTSYFETLKLAVVLLGLVMQILAISVTVSLIHNMAPPKRVPDDFPRISTSRSDILS